MEGRGIVFTPPNWVEAGRPKLFPDFLARNLFMNLGNRVWASTFFFPDLVGLSIVCNLGVSFPCSFCGLVRSVQVLPCDALGGR
jgi:hypothetical protein